MRNIFFCGIGEHELKGPTFHKAEYTLSNIIKWGGESVYTIGEQNELIQKSDKASRVIYKGLNFSISYFVAGSFLPPIINQDLLIEHIKLEQHGIIAIEFEKEVEFNCLHEIFEKLKKLIEIALIGRVNIENIDVYSSNYSEQFGNTIVETSYKSLWERCSGKRNKNDFSKKKLELDQSYQNLLNRILLSIILKIMKGWLQSLNCF